MKAFVLAIAALTGVETTTFVSAADLQQPFIVPAVRPESATGWSLAVSPYFWGARLSGDVGQFGLPAIKLESDFADILKDLDFSFMAVGEARYEGFSLFGDIIYTRLSAGAATPLGLMTERVDVTSETFSGLAGAGYSVFRDGRSTIDVVAGARVWHVSTDISYSGGLFDGASARDSATWVDAMAGFRGRYFLSDQIYLSSWGLVGAGQAKLDWDIAAGVGTAFSDRISGVAGYRALGVDYSHDNFVFNVVQQGPILGLAVRF